MGRRVQEGEHGDERPGDEANGDLLFPSRGGDDSGDRGGDNWLDEITLKGHHTDKRLDRLQLLLYFIIGVSIVGGSIIIGLSYSGRNNAALSADNSSQTVTGNNLAACRSKFNIPVQDARGEVAVQDSEMAKVANDLYLLVIRAYRANLEGDTSQFTALIQESKAIELRLATANRTRAAAADEEAKALVVYDKAVADSVNKPESFLKRCGLRTTEGPG